jgi:D-serine deaminase-like pyridoxal phosphate-dependent protein
MPSLFGASYSGGVDVGANYGRMVPQQTYGIGEPFTNFGTRQLQIIKVANSGGTNDLRKGADGSTGSYQDSNSLFSKAVRALQTYAEVYAVYAPTANAFFAVVSLDTANSSDSGNGDTDGAIGTGYGLLEAAVQANLNSSASVTISALTLTDGATI